ncbi:EF-hand domain pair [Phytophthora infestans]|uniref:EF-hand domain pair n=1 Tax=Phytophthora infestans TaxID=4787 RepID=A0A833SXC9_PHYIN|nr:EF-hand domain pair [Phytophthora infestans]
MAFYWECASFPLAMAPWCSESRRQQKIFARVAVAEQRTPGFALRFDLELLEEAEMQGDPSVLMPCMHLMRLVNQRQMLRAFEFAFAGAGAEKRRPGGEEADDELLDLRLKKWLAGGGRVPAPPKEELVKWLLTWMVITPTTADSDSGKWPDWLVLMCGEKVAEYAIGDDNMDLAFDESGDASDPVYYEGNDNGDNDDRSGSVSGGETEDDDDLPPPYEIVEVSESKDSPDSEDENDFGNEEQANEQNTTRLLGATHSNRSLQTQDQNSMQQMKRRSSIRSSSSRSLASATSKVSLPEKKEFKLTTVRLNPRLNSLDVDKLEEPSNEWSDARRHLHKELGASRRDVQTAKQLQDKAEKLANLRHTQLVKESARKLRINEQKRRDAQAVRQTIADTLEYRDELNAMESRLKQAAIAAHRHQERLKRQARVVMGNIEKTPNGTIKLGSGPLSKKEMELILGSSRTGSAVYDLHGRRRSLEEADMVTKETALESAMRKVRRLVLSSKNGVEVFRRYDLDRSRTLSYSEFQRLLRENGTGNSPELTQEQSSALFKRFDLDSSGEIHYEELLWGFFNREAFLKRWHERESANTTASSDGHVKESFTKYDPSGRGVLPLKDFQLVLDHLGVTLGDADATLLAVKFDAGKDGYVDYHKFLNFVNLSGTQDLSSIAKRDNSESTTPSDFHARTAPPGMERIWMELQELSTTQAKLHRLLQK